jgi:TonB family protein
MLENLLNSPLLTSLALTLLHFLWQGILVATVLKSALLIFNNSKPQLRYALSALAMLVNLLLPIVTFFIIYRTENPSANYLADSFALNELIQELKQPDSLFSYQDLIETLPLLLPYVAVLWLIAITLLASKLLIEISTVNKLPHQAVVKPSDKLQARFIELAKQINLKIVPRLLISLKVDVPMAIGWLKPVVLIPANMVSGLNNSQLEMLILHELAHIRRHDYLVNFLQTLVEILLFFHPAVSWISKQMRNEREYCSDDIAVQHCGDAIAYAHTLADTASLCTKAHNHTIPDMAMAASGGDLKLRVIRLVDHHCASNSNISKWLASAAIIFSILLLSSKQLLTIPLLDIWHNPWKQNNNINKFEVNNNQTLFNSKAPETSLSNTSLAQQLAMRTGENESQDLLANKAQLIEQKSPVQASINVKEISISTEKVVPNTAQSKIKNHIQPANTSKLNEKAVDEFNLQLNNLSAKNVTKANKSSNSLSTQDSLMVKTAFGRTNSNNPYQAELEQLTVPPKENALVESQPINKSKYTTLLKNTSSLSVIKRNESEFNGFKDDNIKKLGVINRILPTFTDVKFKEEQKTTSIWHDAKKLKSVNPVYPNIAKRKGIELEVEVNFTIGTNGQIKNLHFVHQQRVSYFKNSIRSAIKQWRFLPAKINDKPVESQMSKVFAFSLQR